LQSLTSLKGSTVSSKLLICVANWNCQQSRRHTSIFMAFGSSDDRVLLTVYPAEPK